MNYKQLKSVDRSKFRCKIDIIGSTLYMGYLLI